MFKPIYHGVTVARLRQLLADVRDDVIVMPNDLRNLVLFVPMPGGGFGFLGFVDMAAEDVEAYDPTEWEIVAGVPMPGFELDGSLTPERAR